jgi:hypothetical protein
VKSGVIILLTSHHHIVFFKNKQAFTIKIDGMGSVSNYKPKCYIPIIEPIKYPEDLAA